jgi:hypothetical protein
MRGQQTIHIRGASGRSARGRLVNLLLVGKEEAFKNSAVEQIFDSRHMQSNKMMRQEKERG